MITRQVLRSSIVLGILLLFAAFTVLAMGAFRVKEANAQGKCTLKTIQGTYLFEGQGTVVQDGKVLPYAEAGVWTLDGKKDAVGVISASIDGVSFATRDPFTATYAMESDCVYTVVDAFGLKVDLYTTPAGKTITYYSEGFSGTQYRQ